MKISINIPRNHFAHDKPVYLLTGDGELLAYQEVFVTHEDGDHITKRGPLMVKVRRCIFKEGFDGNIRHQSCCSGCIFYKNDKCPLGEEIPLSCAKSDCSKHHESCNERFEIADGLVNK